MIYDRVSIDGLLRKQELIYFRGVYAQATINDKAKDNNGI
jgi:hypothetical protein